MSEANLTDGEHGKTPAGPGWYVLNTGEAVWYENDRFGSFCNFEGDVRFDELGINIHVLSPGKPACLYHRENAQEDFLVLSGECLLLIDGQERPDAFMGFSTGC